MHAHRPGCFWVQRQHACDRRHLKPIQHRTRLRFDKERFAPSRRGRQHKMVGEVRSSRRVTIPSGVNDDEFVTQHPWHVLAAERGDRDLGSLDRTNRRYDGKIVGHSKKIPVGTGNGTDAVLVHFQYATEDRNEPVDFIVREVGEPQLVLNLVHENKLL